MQLLDPIIDGKRRAAGLDDERRAIAAYREGRYPAQEKAIQAKVSAKKVAKST